MDVTLPEQIIVDALDFLGVQAQRYHKSGLFGQRNEALMAWWDLSRYIPVITMFQALEALKERGLDDVAWFVQRPLNI